MLTKEDYEVFYYVTPRQYRYKLDGDRDPNYRVNRAKLRVIADIITKMTVKEYLQFILQLFLKKYGNPDFLLSVSLYWGESIEDEHCTQPNTESIEFDYIEFDAEKDEVPPEMGFLKRLYLVFKEPQPSLSHWVEAELQGVSYQKVGNTSITIESSPIAKIEIGTNTIEFRLNKQYYIDYREI